MPVATQPRALRFLPADRKAAKAAVTPHFGNHDDPAKILDTIKVDSTLSTAGTVDGSVVTGQTLTTYIAEFPGRVGGCKFRATDIGLGTGNTVLDVQIDGTSVWTSITDAPTLQGSEDGEFANTYPDRGAFQQGQVVRVRCLGTGTKGHKLAGTVAILAPGARA